MSEFGKIDSSSDAWYACSGECDDVVVSTRIRLARNLANFPFPDRCSAAVVEQIQSIVFDSFTRIPDAEKYNVFSIQNLEESGMNVLKERGFISPPYGTGLVLRSDSKGYCVINSRDHIRLAGISAGLAAESAFAMCHTMDENLQQVMQFAASYDFGFLTASLGDVGSGMKASLRVHLPSILYMDRLQNLAAEIERRGFAIKATFALDSMSKGALGDFYDVCSLSAFDGNELDQLIALTSIGKYIVEQERLCRQEGLESKPTRLHDIVYRAYALIKYSRFISLQESLGLLSALKWGSACGIMKGIEDTDIAALLYRVQNAHLQFMLQSGKFDFEQDIIDDKSLKIQRLRSLVLQEAVENIGFTN